jgi:ethanolamine-phosphate cytidylyltransferase
MQEPQAAKKPVRVWIDMCADMFHFGHANALRQAKMMGDVLVVGIHPDAEILKNKGPPVMTQEERLAVVKACKWVDEVTLDAPYQTTLATLDKFNIDFCVHGEDISINSDGTDSFEEVKKAGRFRLIKRTDGVSTTDLVGRMLLLTKNHFDRNPEAAAREVSDVAVTKPTGDSAISSRTLYQFANSNGPKEGDRIGYMDGGFDLFHAGHCHALQQARELCDYLIVGVHTDQDINRSRGENFPIMNLHERALCVLSCRYADEVIIGAPWILTKKWLENMRISIVFHGDERDEFHPVLEGPDPYAAAKEMNIYREVKSTPGLHTSTIVQRVINNRIMYEKRNRDRAARDAEYEKSKFASSSS